MRLYRSDYRTSLNRPTSLSHSLEICGPCGEILEKNLVPRRRLRLLPRRKSDKPRMHRSFVDQGRFLGGSRSLSVVSLSTRLGARVVIVLARVQCFYLLAIVASVFVGYSQLADSLPRKRVVIENRANK